MKDMSASIYLSGRFKAFCFDKNGRLKWVQNLKNGVTNVGLDLLLDVLFGATSKPANWYVGLIRDDNYSALAAGDTMASHAGWEEGDEYSESTRPGITFGSAASQAISNSSTVNFSINATETMKGAFLVTNNTKNGSTGTLWCTALFDGGDQAVANGDTIKITYEVSASAA